MFLYRGFSQSGNVRSFRFDHVFPGTGFHKSSYVPFTLKADMLLLSGSRIPVQDGPALCLHILAAWPAVVEAPPEPVAYTITSRDVGEFAALKRQALAKPIHRKLPRPKPSAASQLRWPIVK